MRGEDPAAIRVFDLTPPKRKEIVEKNVKFVRTDITDLPNVLEAFNRPWPDHVKSQPLTVYHCAAYIGVTERTMRMSNAFHKINIQGTANIIKAAQIAGATILISTSSISVGQLAPSFWPLPWASTLKNFWQCVPNGDRDPLLCPLSEYSCCYAWSKAHAEDLISKASNPSANFLTGALRPGQTIYGPGGANKFSLTYTYLSRGGAPSWIFHMVLNLVHAENVSIAHLAFENTLLIQPDAAKKISGKAYAVTDPSPPITFGAFYNLLTVLADPLKPVKFIEISAMPMVLLSYVIEFYVYLRFRFQLLDRILPDVTGDMKLLQPGMLRTCLLHTMCIDEKARREIGYRAAYGTLEGLATTMVDWNEEVVREARKQSGTEEKQKVDMEIKANDGVPVGPTAG